jgi:hypothetical protein
VTQLCRIAQVSRTAYYEWQDGELSQRERGWCLSSGVKES